MPDILMMLGALGVTQDSPRLEVVVAQLVVLVILVGALAMPLLVHLAHAAWALARAVLRAMWRYVVDKLIETILWGLIAIVGGWLFWG